MDRLQLLSRAISEKFRKATPEKQRAACLAACGMAIAQTLSDDAMARDTLRQLQGGYSFTKSQKKRIEVHAFQLDEAYLDLQDKVDEGDAERADSLQAFFKARAMTALSFSVSDKPGSAHEAIYEAAAAMGDDEPRLLSAVEACLD
jgi:hypothetical protein